MEVAVVEDIIAMTSMSNVEEEIIMDGTAATSMALLTR
jgi:hypothetical protein